MPRIAATTRAVAIHEVSPGRLPQYNVTRTWNNACKLWSIFGFAKPRINRSILDGRGVHEKEIAYMNFAEKRVTVNLHRLEQLGILDLLESVFVHELGHKFCPANLKTMLLINSAVMHAISDQSAAQQLGNLYRDMLVNVDAHRRGDRGIPEVYARLWKNSPDPVQQIIGRAYERLFQRQDTSKRYAQTIIQTAPAPEIEAAADRIVDIILNSRRSNWLRSARDFASVLKPFIDAMGGMGQGNVYVISNMTAQDFSKEGRSPIPPDGRSDVKQLERRLGGVVFDLRQLEDGGNDKKPCSINEFRKFLISNNISITQEEANIWYYRDLIGGKVVKVPEVSVSSGALFPFAPKTWQPGDSPQELDVVLSKSVGGVLIPGQTTKKWEMRRGKHIAVGKDYPDLDLWMDCSPSMADPSTSTSQAVAAGMIVSKSFLATRKSVRVVTWSGNEDGSPRFVSTDGFIRDEDEIDSKIIAYEGDWTILPMDEFEKPYKTEGKEKYIVMITDLGIANLDEATLARLEIIFKRSVGGTIFLIGSEEETKDAQTALKAIGFDVKLVEDISQLDQHALKLTKQLFEERIAL